MASGLALGLTTVAHYTSGAWLNAASALTLAFFGIRNVRDVATCLYGYDQTHFPRASDWSFTRFYLPQAIDGGYRLSDDAPLLWAAFEQHHKHGLPGELEIPMESFARAVEIVLKESELRDTAKYRPQAPMWNVAVRSCGYIQSRQAVSQELKTALS